MLSPSDDAPGATLARDGNIADRDDNIENDIVNNFEGSYHAVNNKADEGPRLTATGETAWKRIASNPF
jgi:hypothetical protein